MMSLLTVNQPGKNNHFILNFVSTNIAPAYQTRGILIICDIRGYRCSYTTHLFLYPPLFCRFRIKGGSKNKRGFCCGGIGTKGGRGEAAGKEEREKRERGGKKGGGGARSAPDSVGRRGNRGTACQSANSIVSNFQTCQVNNDLEMVCSPHERPVRASYASG